MRWIEEVLAGNDLDVKRGHKDSLYLYSRVQIQKFFDLVGTSNEKHARKWSTYQEYIKSGNVNDLWMGVRVV